MKASLTIEAAVIIPLILLLFAGIITVLFYYHDKNIITAAVYEVAAVESETDEIDKEEFGKKLQERVNKKLLLFSKIYMNIQIEETDLRVYCRAEKGRMTLHVQISMSRTDPETWIRNIRRIEKIKEQMGETL